MPNPSPLDLPPQEPDSPGSISNLDGLIRFLIDKGWLILTCLVLAVIAAAIYVQRATRIYEAVATVQVEQEEQKVVKVEQVRSEDLRTLDMMNTIAQKLCSPALVEQVLQTNNLLPAAGTVVTNAAGKRLTRDDVLASYEDNIKAVLRRNTRLIDISVRNKKPELAARLANSLVQNYLLQEAVSSETTTTSADSFLKREADRLKSKLEDAEQRLADYRKQVGAVSLEQNQDIVTPQLQNLNQLLTQSQANLVQAQGAYQDSLKMGTNVDTLLAYPGVANATEVMSVSSQLADAENQFAILKQRYRRKHPKYIQAQAAVDALKAQLAKAVLKLRTRTQESLRIAYKSALTAEQGLEAQLHTAESNAMQLGDTAVKFNVLTREVAADRAMFDSVINRLNETSVAGQIAPERITVVQPAMAPDKPASPKVALIFALAVFGGLGLGFGISLLLYTLNTSFRTVEDVEHHLGMPVLGAVPKVSASTGGKDNKLVAAEGSTSVGAEVFRSLRTTVSMLGREEDRRICLFTSSLPNEGKTFTSVNYAVSLAQQGLRTLLVDADLRKPSVIGFFLGNGAHLSGITDYFLGRKSFDEICIEHKGVPHLSWMPVGTLVPNPSELLTQSDFRRFLQECLTRFDRIVIDTAPVLPVSDTLLLADKVQTVVLVVQGNKTSCKAVERGLQLLKGAGAPISGIVLNLLPHRRFGGYYYSYYHGYGYGYYGDKRTKKSTTHAA